jgi:anti-sigma factor RsiW
MNLDSSCQHTVLALPWLLNGSLEAAERRAVREHLIGCAACRTELAQTRQALALFQAAEPVQEQRPAPVSMPARRAAGSAPMLRRLALAAAIAAVVMTGGRVWLRLGREQAQEQAQNRLQERRGTTVLAAAPVDPLVTASPVRAAAAPASTAAAQPAVAVVASPRLVHRRAIGPARSHRAQTPAVPSASGIVISRATFEQGNLASLDVHPTAAKLSANDFESGLGSWTERSGSSRP